MTGGYVGKRERAKLKRCGLALSRAVIYHDWAHRATAGWLAVITWGAWVCSVLAATGNSYEQQLIDMNHHTGCAPSQLGAG